MKIHKTTYLSLGTNQGNKLENLQNAINEIDHEVGAIQSISSIYKTRAWGFDGDDFYNICIKVTTYLKPEALMRVLLEIENKLGRTRSSELGYQSRNIDIDILLFDDEVIISKNVTVPHPKMLKRRFVMIPLAEIASSIIHPVTKEQIEIWIQNGI